MSDSNYSSLNTPLTPELRATLEALRTRPPKLGRMATQLMQQWTELSLTEPDAGPVEYPKHEFHGLNRLFELESMNLDFVYNVPANHLAQLLYATYYQFQLYGVFPGIAHMPRPWEELTAEEKAMLVAIAYSVLGQLPLFEEYDSYFRVHGRKYHAAPAGDNPTEAA